MNENDLDKIYKILEEDYKKAFTFADSHCKKEDIVSFKILFSESLRKTFENIKSIMTDRAIDGRSE